MRIVLDTNVLVSGLLSESGPTAQIVDLCIAGEIELVVDERIVREYRDVLARPEFGFDADAVNAFLELLALAERVVAGPLPLTLPDPDDLPFIEVAAAAAADAIVTGNTRHFKAPEGRLDVPVMTPRQFADRLAR